MDKASVISGVCKYSCKFKYLNASRIMGNITFITSGFSIQCDHLISCSINACITWFHQLIHYSEGQNTSQHIVTQNSVLLAYLHWFWWKLSCLYTQTAFLTPLNLHWHVMEEPLNCWSEHHWLQNSKGLLGGMGETTYQARYGWNNLSS